jgi:hypothetical protein
MLGLAQLAIFALMAVLVSTSAYVSIRWISEPALGR